MSRLWRVCMTVVTWNVIAVINVTVSQPNCIPPCPPFTQCDNGRCVCPDNTIGEPDFDCYDGNLYLQCQIYGDLILTPFKSEPVKIFMPASASVSSTRILQNGYISRREVCSLKVQAWTTRFHGTFHISGAEFVFEQFNHKGDRRASRRGRIMATVTMDTNGSPVYQWEVMDQTEGHATRWQRGLFSSTVVIKTNGRRSFRSTISKNCAATFRRDEADFLTVTFDCCDQSVGLRPYSAATPERASGLWVKVKRQGITPSRFGSAPRYLCHSIPERRECSDASCKSLGGDAVSRGGVRTDRALTILALASGTPTNYPGSPANLKEVKGQLAPCPRELFGYLFELTSFLFSDYTLVAEINSTQRLLALIGDVSGAVCQPDVTTFERCLRACDVIKKLVPSSDATPSLKRFFNSGYCSQ